MFQEYRDWERAFQKQTANERAKINTARLWSDLKPHIPVARKKNRWLPFVLFLGVLALALPAWLWTQNRELRATNANLHIQLKKNALLLADCQSNNVHRVQEDMANPVASLPIQHLPASTMRTRKSPDGVQFVKPAPAIFPVLEKPDLQNSKIDQPAVQSRDVINFQALTALHLRLSKSPESLSVPTKRLKSSRAVPHPTHSIDLALLAGTSTLHGSFNTANAELQNIVDQQYGVQLHLHKYLSQNWFVGAELQYLLARNETQYKHTSEQRTETNGTTQIVIDGNGQLISSNGIKGATAYQQIRARLYNWQQQVLIGPALGYVFYKDKSPLISLSASVQWALNSGMSGKSPLGQKALPGAEADQWIYTQKLPMLGLGANWHQQLRNRMALTLGLQTSYQSDQFTGSMGIMERSGLVWSSKIGIKKNF